MQTLLWEEQSTGDSTLSCLVLSYYNNVMRGDASEAEVSGYSRAECTVYGTRARARPPTPPPSLFFPPLLTSSPLLFSPIRAVIRHNHNERDHRTAGVESRVTVPLYLGCFVGVSSLIFKNPAKMLCAAGDTADY